MILTPQIYRTPIESVGLDDLTASLAHILSGNTSTGRKKLTLPSSESAKMLVAISMQPWAKLTSPAEKWANRTGMNALNRSN